jgi:hypothetical protein
MELAGLASGDGSFNLTQYKDTFYTGCVFKKKNNSSS